MGLGWEPVFSVSWGFEIIHRRHNSCQWLQTQALKRWRFKNTANLQLEISVLFRVCVNRLAAPKAKFARLASHFSYRSQPTFES